MLSYLKRLKMSCLCPPLSFFPLNFSLSLCTSFSKEVMIQAPVSSALRNILAGGEIWWVFPEKSFTQEESLHRQWRPARFAWFLSSSPGSCGGVTPSSSASLSLGRGNACLIAGLRLFSLNEQKENMVSWGRITQLSRC